MQVKHLTWIVMILLGQLFIVHAEMRHIVRNGETLAGISKYYNLPLATIINSNPDIEPDKIKSGQQIKIPKKQTSQSSPKKISPLPSIHVVQRGDSLIKISKKYGVSITQLRVLNQLKSNTLYVGQKLILQKNSTIAPKQSVEKKPPPQTPSRPQYTFITPKVKAQIDSPKQIKRWKRVIVHHSGTPSGNARIFNYYHSNIRHMENGLAYHFIIGNGTDSGDGQIEVGPRWFRQIKGGHVVDDNINEIAIGICLVGNFNKNRPTPRQIASLVELLTYLNSISPEGRLKFETHREAHPQHTDCPGKFFPTPALHKIFG